MAIAIFRSILFHHEPLGLLDLSPEQIARGKERFPHLDLRVGSGEKAVLPEGPFDVVSTFVETWCHPCQNGAFCRPKIEVCLAFLPHVSQFAISLHLGQELLTMLALFVVPVIGWWWFCPGVLFACLAMIEAAQSIVKREWSAMGVRLVAAGIILVAVVAHKGSHFIRWRLQVGGQSRSMVVCGIREIGAPDQSLFSGNTEYGGDKNGLQVVSDGAVKILRVADAPNFREALYEWANSIRWTDDFRDRNKSFLEKPPQ